MDINNEQITKVENTNEYDKLIEKVGETLQRGRNKLASALKGIMVETYWEIGRDIVEFEQCGNAKAEYGSDTLNRLSKDLTERYGKGFSRTNVVYIRKLYLVYPNSQTLSDQLSFSFRVWM